MTCQEFISQNLFLAEHKGLSEFVRLFVESVKTGSRNDSKFSIICERAEDLYPIQQQVLFELNSILGKNCEIVGGLSFYTLDKLGQSLCSFFAIPSLNNANLGSTSYFNRPYVNVKKQEQIVALILNLLHVPVQGSRMLAKQILALIDLPLPPDLTLAEALFGALNIKKNKRTYHDIPELFLKQLLAAFQASCVVLNRYSRLQTFVWDALPKLNAAFDSAGTAHIPDFLSGSLLWIAAPEYQSEESTGKNFKSGDFLSPLVEDIFNFISNLHKNYFASPLSCFFRQRTVLKTIENAPQILSQHKFYCAENRRDFYHSVCLLAEQPNLSEFVITGEFDSNSFQTIQSDGSGAYQLMEKDFFNWQTNNADTLFARKISEELDERYDTFLDTISYIENYSKLQDIAKIYAIPIRDLTDDQLQDIFRSMALSETFGFCQENKFANFPKKYEFYATQCIPKSLTVLWDGSHFEKNDFSTRVLNQIFSYLQSHGVEVDNPFTEKLFACFWKHMIGLSDQIPGFRIEFILSSLQSLDMFPIELKKIKYLPLSTRQFNSGAKPPLLFAPKMDFYPESWFKFDDACMQKIFDQVHIDQVSTTQFETYVRCPFQFFFEHVLELKSAQEDDAFSVDNQALGIKVHKICDFLLSRMVEKFGNDGYVSEAPKIYQTVLLALQKPEIFLNPVVDVWKAALAVLPHDEKTIFFEICDEIFCTQEQTHLKSILFIELLKRTLFKFLQTEIQVIAQGFKYRVGIVREYPFEITLSGLTIRGRIDRVDLNKNGYEVIDYKVSAVSKGDKSLCILPKEIQSLKNKSIASIQGAIYVLAFGKKVFHVYDTEQCFSAFSLYRLKNIKHEDEAILSYSFLSQESAEPSNVNEKNCAAQMRKIEEALSPYAKNLLNKKFFPDPLLKKQTCQYCNFTKLCPHFLREYDSL